MAEKQGVGDLYELIKTYAKQQIVEPLQGAGRWIAMGVLGSILLMIGGVTLTLAMLRLLQEETGTSFTGNLSWVPYGITIAALLCVIGLLGYQITKKTL